MELNQELIKDLLSRKKKGSKTEELKKYRELILELRNLGLSINDICIYLKREHKIKVSPATLKSAFPELTSRLKQFERIVKNMDDNELKKAYEIVRKEIASRNTSTT
jgi:DNA-binding transcriptional MerR regulator